MTISIEQTIDCNYRNELLNNYAIADDTLDTLAESASRVTVADVFCSAPAAKSAVSAMRHLGLQSDQIMIIAKNYQEPQYSANWKQIAASDDLTVALTHLGISNQATSQFIDAIEDGKFLMIATVVIREFGQTQHVLEKIGHWVSVVH
jgi:hypothetical protein